MERLIEYKNVTLAREEQTLFRGIDFDVKPGEFIYLIGKVGSGKSSLLKSIYAELPVAAGEARVFDFNLAHLKSKQVPALRRKLGIIFQDFQLLTDRTVEENLRFVLKATGWTKKPEMDDRIKNVLEQVGMESKGYRMPNTLSGGEQQRVVIARSLLNAPSVILADEPTGNLDSDTGRNIVSLLWAIAKEGSTAVVMSTHNLSMIESFPGRVLRVEDQKLADVTAEFLPNGESPAETQSDVPQSADDSSSADAHCSPQDTEPEEPCHSGQSDQTPSESTPPEAPCTPE
jgi:cell division transport system ATP-binding protein